MTPTKDDALAALDYLYSRATMRLDQIETEMNSIGHSSPMAISEIRHFIQCAKQALTQPRETVSTTMDYDLIAPVAHYFNGDADKTKAWFETPNPNLGGVKPIDTPRDRLLKFITEQTLTQPPVDVEALKRECYGDSPIACRASIDRAIDHLVSKGYLK